MTSLDEALAFHRAGQLVEAEDRYRRLLEAEPGNADAWHLAGILKHQQGQTDAAVALIGQALALAGPVAPFQISLGNAHMAAGRTADAIAAFAPALDDPGTGADAHANTALALKAMGNAAAARAHLRQALARRPEFPEAWNSLAATCRDLGQLDDALAAGRTALLLTPDYVEAWHNRGNALHGASLWRAGGDPAAEAIRAFERATRTRPEFAPSHNARANLLQSRGRLAEAEATNRRALLLAPDLAPALQTRATVVQAEGGLAPAVAAYRRVLAVVPDHDDASFNLAHCVNLLPDAPPDAAVKLRRRWSDRACRPLAEAAPPHANDRDPDRRLRIGYVGGGMLRRSSHATALVHVLEHHDRRALEITCYSDLATWQEDPLTERHRRACDRWRITAGQGDDEVAEQIRTDGIDVLVDLTAHSGGPRARLFARRPAPVQVTFLHVGSSGIAGMTHALVDPRVCPEGAESWFSEALVRVPCCYLFQPVLPMPEPVPPPSLAAGRVTFGSVNGLYKIDRRVIALWARVMAALPDSRLIMKAGALADPPTRERYRALLAEHGVDPGRVDLRGWTARLDDHVATYNEFDLILDAFPFNGVTTASEALWMGVPVVTLAGDRMASRYGFSQLGTVGLTDDCVAFSPDSYVEKAVRLARDVEKRRELRATLRKRYAASLCGDPVRFTRDLERAWRAAWRQWCAAPEAAPTSIDVCTSEVGRPQ
jgi:predicted O-linked N-acetylglucosamine transferase (SPINDLY family)